MAAKCGKCDPHEICEECPEWIFTLADLIMCMMGLFVLLWVLKPSPNPPKPEISEDMMKVLTAVREAFGYVPDPTSKDPVDVYMLLKKLEENPIKGPGDGGRTKLPVPSPIGTNPETTTIRAGKTVSLGGRMSFDRGSSNLNEPTLKMVEQLVQQVKGHRNLVLIKGHTSLDDYIDDDSTPQQKMELSLRRAQAVSDYLISKGVAAEILRVQGASVFEPVVQRQYTEGAHAMNRRVEIEVMATLVDDLQDTSAPKGAPLAR